MPFIATFVDAVAETLGAGVPVRLGEEFVQDTDAPPRVTFVPQTDTFGPPRRARSLGQALQPSASIATRNVGLEARVWGAAPEETDFEANPYAHLRATELLLDRVMLAIHAMGLGSVTFEGGEWAPTSVAQFGRLYLLRFRVELPVVPTAEDEAAAVSTFTEVLAAAAPPAITTTVVLAADVTATPAP